MRIEFMHLPWLFIFILLLAGCQIDAEDNIPPEPDEDVSFSMEDIEDMESLLSELGELFEGVTSPRAVSYQELQKLLPKKANGVRRSAVDGQNFSIGSGFSQVQGEYEDGDQVVTVTIVDLAAFGKLAAGALSDWMDEEIDRESDRGFERTFPLQERNKEYPAYEKYTHENDYESCEMQAWVEDRFLVAVSGAGVPMSICRTAQDRISFSRLERLAQSEGE